MPREILLFQIEDDERGKQLVFINYLLKFGVGTNPLVRIAAAKAAAALKQKRNRRPGRRQMSAYLYLGLAITNTDHDKLLVGLISIRKYGPGLQKSV